MMIFLLFWISAALAGDSVDSGLIQIYNKTRAGIVHSLNQDSHQNTLNQDSQFKLSPGFLYGFSSAAVQVEGSASIDGKSPSVWDVFAAKKDKIKDASTPQDSVQEYKLWNETVTLLRLTGANSYRFSISWPRLVPDGSASSKINQKAIDHYNTLINALLANNITPVVTLYHWDLPQSLQDAYGGFLNTERFTQDFLYFAETAFSLFGDRVKYWLTFNEPSSYCLNGYVTGSHAPGRCINPLTCTFGFVPLDLVRCVHTTLIAHARAVDMYRKKFQSTQKGKISLAINGNWAEPFDSTSEQDKKAAQLQLDFSIGWYADPIFLGRFPQSLTSVIGWMMPTITKQDWTLLKGSADFFGLNQYTTNYVTSTSTKLAQQDKVNVQILPFFFQSTCAKNGTLIGEQGESEWLFNVPFGFKALLKYIDEKYNRPDIIITENGWSVKGEENMTMDQIIHDVTRIDYYQGYLDNMVQAIKEGVRIKGYISWTLLDNWEWATGYTNRFGVTHVDRTTQKRTLKDSAFFLRDYFYNIMCDKGLDQII